MDDRRTVSSIQSTKWELPRQVGLIAFIALAMASGAMATTEDQIGPGVAGQLHALAYDPEDETGATIFAGGDNFGVYITENYGQAWEPWNEGMEQDSPMRTSYIDDLLIVPVDPANPTLRAGVYAATFAGILRRPRHGPEWLHETTDKVYFSGIMAGQGGAIPFASLAYDTLTCRLYAGAGRARKKSNYPEPNYPETGVAGEYSLWCKDLDARVGEPFYDWQEITDIGPDGNVGTIRQMGVVHMPGTDSRLLVASSTGIYIQGAQRIGWECLWDSNGSPLSNWPGYSEHAWGVAVGDSGRAYALTSSHLDGQKPAVFRNCPDVVGGEYSYSPNAWTLLDGSPGAAVPPQDTGTWNQIVDGSDLYSLTVIPALHRDDEEVFCGMIGAGAGEYTGYFRHGKYADGLGGLPIGWVNFLYVDTHGGAADELYDFYRVDYATDATAEVSFDPGWLRRYWMMSTVPLIYHPDDPNRMFVAGYHIPLATGDPHAAPGVWTQRYCDLEAGDPSDGYYRSFGLEEMSTRAIGFTQPASPADTRVVLGCGDFQAFLGNDAGGAACRDMDPFYTGNSEGIDFATIGEDIYVLRGAAGTWADNGFSFSYAARDTPSYISRQDHVIALYDPMLTQRDGDDGYHWRFISRAFDALPEIASLPDTVLYDITDIECADDTTMFASLRWVVEGSPRSMVMKGVKGQSAYDWAWTPWWRPVDLGPGGIDIKEMKVLPGTDRLLVLGSLYESPLTAIDVDTREWSSAPYQTGVSWLNKTDVDALYPSGHRMRMSIKNLQTVACDAAGDWVYLAGDGQTERNQYSSKCANVLRVAVPPDASAPPITAWEMLLNREDDGVLSQGITYPPIHSDYWPDTWGSPMAETIAENVPHIGTLQVHPTNPLRVFIGIRVVTPAVDECFHANNGVWEYTPDAGNGTWAKLPGAGLGDPCHGVNAIAFDPHDPSAMIVGTHGQGFFRVSGIPASPPPVSGVTALQPIHPEQTLLMVEFEPAVNEVIDVWVDARGLGLDRRLHLVDDGTGDDWAAGDGIWTVSVAGHTITTDETVLLPCYARDADWNSFYGEVAMEVLAEAPAQFFRNVSAATNAEFPGQPAGVAALEINATQNPADQGRDVYISTLDDGDPFVDRGSLLLRNGLSDGVPQFENVSDVRFGNDRPAADHGPATAACLNGDALPDLIVPAGSSGEGLLLFRQDETTFTRRDGWLGGLSADLQANTWTAACGDYDGDGQLDIYLGRATPDAATGLPGPSSDALADILLLSDMAENRVFVDGTAELEIPGGAGDPIHLATSAVSWCDFDRDGDLDLAVADGGTQRGVFIYENDPEAGDERFSLIEPTDPVNAPWGQNVADIVWTDVDGDGWRDLVAVTVSGQLPATAIHVLYNDPMELDGRFKAPALLYSVPDDHRCHGLRAVDSDLDGDEDLLLLTDQAHGTPLLLLNDGGTMTAAPSGTGLAALIGPANGALVTDMDQDGDAELFLGRAESTASFFCLAETAAGGAHWLALDLLDQRVIDAGVVDVPAVGATVVVDLGGGDAIAHGVEADGRTDPTVRFGVAGEQAPACTVTWPSGHQVVYSNLALDAVNTLRAPTAVGLVADSVRGFTEVKPDEVADWVFRWTTTYQEDRGLTRVVLDTDDPDACAVAATELQPGDPNVRYQQWSGQADGALVFYHELRWLDRPCRRCSIAFTLESGRADDTGSVIETSATETLSSRLCTSLDPNDPPGGE